MTTTLVLAPGADDAALVTALQGRGVWAQRLRGGDGRVWALALEEHSAAVEGGWLADLPGVAAVCAADAGHPRLDAQRGCAVTLGAVGGAALAIGPGLPPLLWAGPCSAESEATAWAAAELVARAGGRLLRGGAFKPRTSPYAYAGAGDAALSWLSAAARAHGLLLVSEATSERHAEAVAQAADVLQVGSRSMASYGLLQAVGVLGKPVLLKRGLAATLHEWRLAAEHLLAAGAPGVVLCERGIAGHDRETRNVLDLGAVALLAGVDRLAVIVDPSHAAGRRDLVAPLARAALAAGAHGVLVEAHPDATLARSDGPQALAPAELLALGALFRAPEPARAVTA